MYSKDLERLTRSFVAQKLERDYIVHYLVETYQLDLKTAYEILEKVSPTPAGRGGRPGKVPDGVTVPVKRQRFY